MKAQRTILMAILLGLVYTVSGYASEGKAAIEAVECLHDQFTNAFKYVPWEDVVDESESPSVYITFRVNDELDLEEVQVNGKNEELVDYARVALTKIKIKADKALQGNKYSMEIRFVKKS